MFENQTIESVSIKSDTCDTGMSYTSILWVELNPPSLGGVSRDTFRRFPHDKTDLGRMKH